MQLLRVFDVSEGPPGGEMGLTRRESPPLELVGEVVKMRVDLARQVLFEAAGTENVEQSEDQASEMWHGEGSSAV
jgi:hypothetical protein